LSLTLERAFKLLEDRKRIVSKQPDGRRSRRKYCRPLSESINLMDSGGKKASICEIGIHQIEPPKASICELPLKTKRERYSADVGKFKADAMTTAITATNVSDLIEKLQPLFPEHNVAAEYERCLKYRKGSGLAPGGGKKFAEWMLRAEKPLKGQSGAETSDPEPNGFPSWWVEQRFKDSPPCPRWSDAPEWARREFLATRRRPRGRRIGTANELATDQYKAG
jgi:hypothetical protein